MIDGKITRSAPAATMRFATSLAPMATLGWSFLSCRPYPKYGTTAVTRAADALLAASMSSRSSMMLSAGATVGWTMKTSRPRAFRSMRTKISLSAKFLIVAPSGDFPIRSPIS